jgi:hypothetical protein
MRRNNVYKVKRIGDYRNKYVIKEVPKSPFYHSDRTLNVSSRMIMNKLDSMKSRPFVNRTIWRFS